MAPLADSKIKTKRNEEVILMKNRGYKDGSMVMNRYQGTTRFGVVQSKRQDSDGWANYRIHFFKDDAYQASQRHRAALTGEDFFKETYRADEVILIDPQWLSDVLKSYGEYHND